MIILFLILMIICFGASAVAMMNNRRYIPATLMTLLLIGGSLWMIAKNDTDYLGMKAEQTQTTTKLTSSYASPLPFLVYKQLGSTQDTQQRVYSYRPVGETKRHLTKHQHFSVHVDQLDGQQKNAQLVKTVKHYQFTNTFWHVVFFGTKSDRTTHTTYDFKVPANWLVLESNQAKQLPKAARKLQAQATPAAKQEIKQQATALVTQRVKAKAPAVIAAQVKAKIAADPSLMQNQSQLQAMQQEVTAAVTKSLTASVTASVEKKQLPAIERQVKAAATQNVVKQLKQQFK